ncbi:cross-pathway control protein 1 [Phyllosticta citriasiana]|uniref:cross-pathway control protein 1 n=1 Tax=Phyllosticta citriasiana TaxID=595635 RepID=UPI0030FDBD29
MSLDSFDWTAFSSANYTSVNDPMSSSIGTATTVSPKDIFTDPLSSAPPSTAFTNLTSPSINESPYLGDSYDTSPLFQQEGDTSSADGWYPLFPSDEKTACDSAPVDNAPALEEQTGATPLDSPQPLVMDTYVRRKSDSKSNSPAAMTHSSVSGVVKSRRRKGPLPPITVQDPSDKVAIKRARNTLAARESRARKYEHVQTLEKRIAELESDKKALADDVEKWKNIALSSGYTPS